MATTLIWIYRINRDDIAMMAVVPVDVGNNTSSV